MSIYLYAPIDVALSNEPVLARSPCPESQIASISTTCPSGVLASPRSGQCIGINARDGRCSREPDLKRRVQFQYTPSSVREARDRHPPTLNERGVSFGNFGCPFTHEGPGRAWHIESTRDHARKNWWRSTTQTMKDNRVMKEVSKLNNRIGRLTTALGQKDAYRARQFDLLRGEVIALQSEAKSLEVGTQLAIDGIQRRLDDILLDPSNPYLYIAR